MYCHYNIGRLMSRSTYDRLVVTNQDRKSTTTCISVPLVGYSYYMGITVNQPDVPFSINSDRSDAKCRVSLRSILNFLTLSGVTSITSKSP